MSLSIQKLKPVEVYDAVTMPNLSRDYIIVKGGKRTNYERFPASSGTTISSQQMTVIPPSKKHIVDRHMYVRWYLQVDFSRTNDPLDQTPMLKLGSYDGFRSYPISTNTSALTITVNTSSVDLNPSDYIQALLRYYNPKKQQDFDLSMTPSQLDQIQNYDDFFAPYPSAIPYNLAQFQSYQASGNARNVFATYGENSAQTSRGAFRYTALTNNINSATIQAEIVEPFFLSPFLWGSGDAFGLCGIDKIDFNFTVSNNGARVWSHSGLGATMNQPVASFYQAPEILCRFVTPQLTEVIPDNCIYPYFKLQRFNADSTSLAPGQSITLSSQNLQLGSVPSKVYVFARVRNQDLTYQSTDTFAYITKLDVQFLGTSGILSSATPQDLYQLSLRNGFDGSWSEYAEYSGSVIALDPAIDFGLDENLTNGSRLNTNLLIQATFTNINPSVSNVYSLYVVVLSEGTFNVSSTETFTQIGVINETDVLNAKQNPAISYADVKAIAKEGTGDFYSGLKNFAKTLIRGAENVVPYVGPAIKIAKALTGNGAKKKLKLKPIVSGGRKKKISKKSLRKGGSMDDSELGGKVMSRSEFKQQMDGGCVSDPECDCDNEVSESE